MNAEVAQVAVPSAPVKAGWILLGVAWTCFVLPVPGLGLFVGWPLNLAAFIVAIVVMTKGRTKPGVLQLLASLIVSPIVYAIGLAVLGAAAIGAADVDSHSTASSTSADSTKAPEVFADDLFRAYDSNEVSADQRFKGRRLNLIGIVAGIGKDAFGEIYVELESGNEFLPVRAQDVSEAVASKLQKGQSVSLLCIGDGMVIGAPVLKQCSVE